MHEIDTVDRIRDLFDKVLTLAVRLDDETGKTFILEHRLKALENWFIEIEDDKLASAFATTFLLLLPKTIGVEPVPEFVISAAVALADLAEALRHLFRRVESKTSHGKPWA